MTIPAAAVLAATAVTAIPAQAADVGNHDYLEARYTLLGKVDYGSTDGDASGLGLEASRSLNDMMFVRLNADMYDVDINGQSTNAALDMFSAGPGIRVPLNTSIPVELWGEFNYERLSVGGAAATGFGVDLGVRGQFSNRFTAGFALKSANTEAGSRNYDYTTYELQAAYEINPRLDLTGSLVNGTIDRSGNASNIDLNNLVRIGLRMPF